MIIDHNPPAGYKPLPPAISETSDRFRVPPLRPTDSFDPRKNVLPSAPYTKVRKPFLRYHGQSSYTDAYTIPGFIPSFMMRTAEAGAWSDPVGKRGVYYGTSSTYERVFGWPPSDSAALMVVPKIPRLQATVGWGIVPILGTGQQEVTEDASERREEEETPAEKKDCRKDYWSNNCDPKKKAEIVEHPETTHRQHFKVFPFDKRELAKQPKGELGFFGKVDIHSNYMRDYPPPSPNYHEQDLLETNS